MHTWKMPQAGHVDPIDKYLKLDGRKYKIVGVFEEKKSAFGAGYTWGSSLVVWGM